MEIKVNNETYYVEFLTYHEPKNMAITVKDWMGAPHCKLSTNPMHELGDNTVAIRDDETYSHNIRDALIKLGVLESLNTFITLGYATATLYKVNAPNG